MQPNIKFLKTLFLRRNFCGANQWTGFYMIGTSIMKELRPQQN